MAELKVRITFTEDILGTTPRDEDIYRNFIASMAPDAATIEDEVAAVGADEVAERGMTGFPRTADGVPFIYDYQVKGFFKDACSMLSRIAGKGEDGKKKPCNESSKLKAFKKVIDGLIFVEPRIIEIQGYDEIGVCQRPLRASTPQGERTALSMSESIGAGAYIDITIVCLSDDNVAAVKEWLDYGRLRGLGQWRNSGKGRFTWAEIE